MMNELQQYQMNCVGDIPLPRFGHTFTQISPQKAILFAGAVGDQGKFVITNETYAFDFQFLKWERIENRSQNPGQIPSNRAAHASSNLELNQLVVFGGASSGGGGLCNDELFLCDFKTNQPSWLIIPTSGQTPGKRYGHSLVYSKPFLIVFGGNSGTVPLNDTWVLNIERSPFVWNKIYETNGVYPQVRVYHSAALCSYGSASGMMVVFGGRTSDQSAMNDTWGLRRHRDGRWDWVQAPYKQNAKPCNRYQHQVNYLGSLMVVTGGRTNSQDDQQLPIEIYDTETSDWFKFQNVNRYRHATFISDTILYMHGGFVPESPNKPLDDLLCFDLLQDKTLNQKIIKIFGQKIAQIEKNNSNILDKQQQIVQKNNGILQDQSNKLTNLNTQTLGQNALEKSNMQIGKKQPQSLTPIKQNIKQYNKNIRISNKVVVAEIYNIEDNVNDLIKRVDLNQLVEESKKIYQGGYQDPKLISSHNANQESLSNYILDMLLKPNEWKTIQPSNRFPIKKEIINSLCIEMINILSYQPNILRIRAPLKIFGSIHGKYRDLLKIFDSYGIPTEDDIERFDYLFLGNLVDYGQNSLEILCIIFALKIKYSEQVHLIRGSHEDIQINKLFGFAEECMTRIPDENINDPNSVFQNVNRVFQYMSLAALIEEKVLCVHAGIGRHLQYIQEIDQIDKPFLTYTNQNMAEKQIIFDLLYSEYVPQDNLDVMENKNKDYFNTDLLSKFGNVRTKKFMQENNISMIIRGQQVCMDGYEQNQSGDFLTVFSCTNFQGKHQNSLAILRITKHCEVIPNVIYPYQVPNQKNDGWIDFSQLSTIINFTEKENKIRQRQTSPPRSKSVLRRNM